jgi:hypothetical protein
MKSRVFAVLILFTGVVFSSFAEPIKMRKLGTFDIFIVEASPIVFKGRLMLMEYLRYESPNKRHRDNDTGQSYFRFRDMSDMKTVTKPFGHGLHLASAFVDGDRVIVTAAEKWGGSKFYLMESTDLENWTEPRLILENPAWKGFNTTLCKADGRYVLSFELGAPKALVGQAFTMFFAESTDLRNWKVVDGAAMGRDRYTGAPMLRYFGGWFYFFHVEGNYSNGFQTMVARSRNLKDWEFSPHVVLDYDLDDRKIHPAARFNAKELKEIAAAANINTSDLDMCEFRGRLVCFYSWGNQRGKEFSALAEADCTEREFCESFFPAEKPAGR